MVMTRGLRGLIVVILIYLTSCGYRDSEQYNGDILESALELEFTYTIHNTGWQSFFAPTEDGGRLTGAPYPEGITYPMIITTRLELDEYLNTYEEAFDELEILLNRSPSRRPLDYYKALEKFDEDFFKYNYLVILFRVFGGTPWLSIDSIKNDGTTLITVLYQGISPAITSSTHFVIELSNDDILEQFEMEFNQIIQH